MIVQRFLRPLTASALVAACALSSLSAAHAADTDQTKPDLPRSMTWSSYDVGSAGYAEASAIADAFGRKYGTRIRIQPSGSAIGRLQPLLLGRAEVGYLATETFFASEGAADFATRRWGPQDLRAVAGRPSSFGVFTAKDAGIESLKDLKGHRFAYVAGNPSINVKCDAFLAFAGLTRDDVEPVMFPTYNAAMSSLAQNQADASCTTTTPSQVYELAESPRGIRWLEVDPNDKAGWDRLKKVAPFFQPYRETIGAGLSEDNPVDILAYRYPVLTVKADTDDDFVYNFIKALDQAYPMYKDGTSVMKRWKLDRAGTPPIDVPFHPGAIKYLKEKGIWTDEMQAWNDQRLARLNALKAAWKDAVAEGEGKSDEAFADIWAKHRQQAIDSL
ncbi:TAXI family TRAP transporter solute-binding subunit [Salinisphaera sp. T31B1]|uniref:TAXI family TRAP transporter solute-binding subunit n=1 Tax=Salinisphaera sp. T31B1 TaxID=727963 RepID=UPI0033402D0A